MAESEEIKTTLCKLSKSDVLKALELIAREVRTARFLCRKCGRAARHKRLLCKPVPLPEIPAASESDD